VTPCSTIVESVGVHACYLSLTGLLFCLQFDREDGGEKCLRNFCVLVLQSSALYSSPKMNVDRFSVQHRTSCEVRTDDLHASKSCQNSDISDVCLEISPVRSLHLSRRQTSLWEPNLPRVERCVASLGIGVYSVLLLLCHVKCVDSICCARYGTGPHVGQVDSWLKCCLKTNIFIKRYLAVNRPCQQHGWCMVLYFLFTVSAVSRTCDVWMGCPLLPQVL
jgi:hypothetical protein